MSEQQPCAPVPGAPATTARTQPLQWSEGATTHVDVRGLAPPQPLVAILRLVRGAPAGTTIVVHHDRDPVMLYPELAEHGWEAQRIAGDPGEVRLLLRAIK